MRQSNQTHELWSEQIRHRTVFDIVGQDHILDVRDVVEEARRTNELGSYPALTVQSTSSPLKKVILRSADIRDDKKRGHRYSHFHI
ncbi:hypothetical protein V6N13_104855 [Hibiscus sabdariffa]|uniref:Uncharacterized protein n=2 Tax=Hibiscus sabdariffa TaxID=183260 RepID=A0ABR2SI67_9ROSI